MIRRDELAGFLNKYFEPYKNLEDESEMVVNGLQVMGGEEVSKVSLGVSASLEFFQRSYQSGCNFLIVHHGLGINRAVINNIPVPLLQERLKFLYKNDISLAGFHFLLDHHPEIGNNTSVLKSLNAGILGNVHGFWGWYGDLSQEKELSEIINFLERLYQHPAQVIGTEKRLIKRIAVVSGSGGPDIEIAEQFREKGIDLLVVGDLRESHFGVVNELGLTAAAFGHYNTETIGIKNLGEVIKKEFPSLPVEFVDVPNE